MVYQSNIHLPEGEKAKVEQVNVGPYPVYVIANAYKGDYDYFATPETGPSIDSDKIEPAKR